MGGSESRPAEEIVIANNAAAAIENKNEVRRLSDIEIVLTVLGIILIIYILLKKYQKYLNSTVKNQIQLANV